MISHSFNYKHQDKRTILFNNNNSYRETVNLSQKMKKYIIKSNQTLNIIVNSKGDGEPKPAYEPIPEIQAENNRQPP